MGKHLFNLNCMVDVRTHVEHKFAKTLSPGKPHDCCIVIAYFDAKSYVALHLTSPQCWFEVITSDIMIIRSFICQTLLYVS